MPLRRPFELIAVVDVLDGLQQQQRSSRLKVRQFPFLPWQDMEGLVVVSKIADIQLHL